MFPGVLNTRSQHAGIANRQRACLPKFGKLFSIAVVVVVVVVVVCPQCERGMSWLQFQIIDLLVQPRAAGVAGTLIFVHIANFATLQPWLHVGSFTCRIFNSLHTHKGPVLLCAPPRHRAMWLNFLLKESPCRQRGLNSAPLGYNDNGSSQQR